FPIWLKPVKGFSSQLGFKIEDRAGLDEALEKMRDGIGDLGHIFDECLDHAELPPEVQGIGGSHAIAESIMSGDQFAHEGYVRNHKVTIHGVLDMMLSSSGTAVAGLRYPADLPDDLVSRANDVGRKIMRQVGFNDGCFNVEFLYDKDTDKLWVIEVNTRISQSHCEMFRMVDGRSNHEIAVSVALGDEPTLPDHKGDFKTSAKFYITKDDDAKVTREPSEDELREISQEFGALVEFEAHEGDTLSDLPNQPVYNFNVGYAWLGADTPHALRERYRDLIARIPMEFSDGQRLSTEM
ncbi:ATP-grasp domain-containing protein, partial [Citreimonas sp.]|uniref:ATP-grasp domain-containing protein n=1 Tax=Citreimonas sp. TaxID=3036715 RepID=UPI00405965F5